MFDYARTEVIVCALAHSVSTPHYTNKLVLGRVGGRRSNFSSHFYFSSHCVAYYWTWLKVIFLGVTRLS